MGEEMKVGGSSGEQGAPERERALLAELERQPLHKKLWGYTVLSGPGWLQSAITLGGGSLASSLYLGVLGGVALLWLQPVAMIMGVIMLSAIGYVTLSTGERPFRAINRHVNPVLGWGWIIATVMANMVWALPQFSLGTAAVRQNLLPGLFKTGLMAGGFGSFLACLVFMLICVGMVWSYGSGGRGVKFFEIVLKVMVAVIVLSFFGVVVKMSLAGALKWGSIFRGLIPKPSLLWSPGEAYEPFLSKVAPAFREFWSNQIVGQRRDVMISATATAVGINMTFLLPYSMLKRRWRREHRGLATFDLSTGLFVPFILATACVVIASASQFHAVPAPVFPEATVKVDAKLAGRYRGLACRRIEHEIGKEAFTELSADGKESRISALPEADKKLAATLVKRDAFDLATSLSPLTGRVVARYVFGIGVVGMAISTIIILMLINGFAVCEILGKPAEGWPFRIGSLMPCIGMLAPFIWTGGKAQFWLAVPTSVFGMTLLPIAYFTFFLLMNQKSLLGKDMPTGRRRVTWNVLMAVAAGLAGFCSIWSVWSKAKWKGMAVVFAFVGLVAVVHFVRKARAAAAGSAPGGSPHNG